MANNYLYLVLYMRNTKMRKNGLKSSTTDQGVPGHPGPEPDPANNEILLQVDREWEYSNRASVQAQAPMPQLQHQEKKSVKIRPRKEERGEP